MCLARSLFLSAVLLTGLPFSGGVLSAQTSGVPSPPTGPQPIPTAPLAPGAYPDNAAGLKKFAKDLLAAQQGNDGARAEQLLQSLVIPDFRSWYPENFDRGATSRVLPQYEASAPTMPAQLAHVFLNIQQDGPAEIEVARFDKDCDDNASEQTFNTLDARLKDFPLYELRFMKGDHFRRVFAFAYVDGGFRFVLTPDFSVPPPAAHRSAEAPGDSQNPAKESPMVRMGGAIQAAKLIRRENPQYPEQARRERLSGTVRLHAIISKDGSVRELRVINGRCSLARASIDAVRKWRYSPTLLEGQPVEVDTTIDVIFSFRQ